MEEQSDNEASEAASPPRDYTDVGDRVAAILNAAEEAASRIRTDASREAKRLRADAEAKANALVEERRREADVEAERVLSSATADAEALRTAAEAATRRIAEVGQQKLEGLRAEARALEGRFETAVDDLRDLTAQLEDVVVGVVRRDAAQPATQLPEDLWPAPELAEAARPEDGRPAS